MQIERTFMEVKLLLLRNIEFPHSPCIHPLYVYKWCPVYIYELIWLFDLMPLTINYFSVPSVERRW